MELLHPLVRREARGQGALGLERVLVDGPAEALDDALDMDGRPLGARREPVREPAQIAKRVVHRVALP